MCRSTMMLSRKHAMTYRYRWQHIQTGRTGLKEIKCLTRLDFLEQLTTWNRQGEGKWLYNEE